MLLSALQDYQLHSHMLTNDSANATTCWVSNASFKRLLRRLGHVLRFSSSVRRSCEGTLPICFMSLHQAASCSLSYTVEAGGAGGTRLTLDADRPVRRQQWGTGRILCIRGCRSCAVKVNEQMFALPSILCAVCSLHGQSKYCISVDVILIRDCFSRGIGRSHVLIVIF